MELFTGSKGDLAHISQADPYMIKAADERYYMYTTGGSLFSSDYLEHGWNYKGTCLQAPRQKNVWAPSVICLNGKYYMYYSSMDQAESNEHKQTMRVAVSDEPGGKFIYQKDIVA
uniref:family 43 glycosylhydrolase n=1 Tax=Muricomes intestini TaxID=1796634 RepID=UPI002FE23F3C